MYGINKHVYEGLLDYFQNEKDIQKVILFGSRSKNKDAFNSDIDLCVDYAGNRKWKVIDVIDEIIGIYSCDILFYDSLNTEIKQQITRDGKVIYEQMI